MGTSREPEGGTGVVAAPEDGCTAAVRAGGSADRAEGSTGCAEGSSAAAEGAVGCPEVATVRAEGCPTATDVALLEGWHGIARGLGGVQEELSAEVARGSRIDPAAVQVLWFLLTRPGGAVPMNQVSRLLGFSTAGTTKVVDRLAELGLIERRPSPDDRRVTFAALTPHGREAAGDLAADLARALRERVVGVIGEEGFTTLVTLTGRLSEGTAGPCGA
ncbi:MarR family winged helix-turn-helix transcriptional regulator [Streptomyces sp. GZWMJZ-114]|uniref:MarR family winged helix-turn-helix transcriptional regulator n=1 Tax=Streptomyces sp. GZWMJZ-114 TaxID=2494734 RepID=UPI0010121C96|nr:MarR family winged helix-turn-helix transcriptional regulator [Streptomyces sp. GZWMJZ-114]